MKKSIFGIELVSGAPEHCHASAVTHDSSLVGLIHERRPINLLSLRDKGGNAGGTARGDIVDESTVIEMVREQAHGKPILNDRKVQDSVTKIVVPAVIRSVGITE